MKKDPKTKPAKKLQPKWDELDALLSQPIAEPHCRCHVEPSEAAKMAEQASLEAASAAADLIRIGATLRAIGDGDLRLSERRRAKICEVWATSLGKLRRAQDFTLSTTGALLPPNHATNCPDTRGKAG